MQVGRLLAVRRVHLSPSSKKTEEIMTLSDCRFYCCGSELNFLMFSNVVCRARYLDSIEMTLLGEGRVDVYAMNQQQPAAGS